MDDEVVDEEVEEMTDDLAVLDQCLDNRVDTLDPKRDIVSPLVLVGLE